MSTSTEILTFTLRSTIFDRHRQLTVTPEYLEFDDNDTAGAPPTRFLRSELEALRYGVKAINGYDFRIGRIYCIDIRSTDGRIIKLRLKSIYRVRLKQLESKYLDIVNTLYKYYFHDMVRRYVRSFQEGHSFDLLEINIDADGVIFDKKIGRIPWDFLLTKRYWTYFTVFSGIDQGQYKAFTFEDDWNAGVLYGVLEMILKIKFPERKV